jgi:hypothetical protein
MIYSFGNSGQDKAVFLTAQHDQEMKNIAVIKTVKKTRHPQKEKSGRTSCI